MMTLPADAFDSNSNYHTPFPQGDALRVFRHTNKTFACSVCPAKRQRWVIMNEVKDHVLGMATFMPLTGENKKKWSRHLIMARNEGLME
ncbi:hypothetical protein SETIT_6G094600v2 [Setaria italica]|uniref:Uncharacterized protein n=1 Tax=Setaria italica TaxID=4555 RepID=A0A368RJR6_SETIT|nr:hypothetical protein SETIT_6G094600v2 [Setaria italica]